MSLCPSPHPRLRGRPSGRRHSPQPSGNLGACSGGRERHASLPCDMAHPFLGMEVPGDGGPWSQGCSEMSGRRGLLPVQEGMALSPAGNSSRLPPPASLSVGATLGTYQGVKSSSKRPTPGLTRFLGPFKEEPMTPTMLSSLPAPACLPPLPHLRK